MARGLAAVFSILMSKWLLVRVLLEELTEDCVGLGRRLVEAAYNYFTADTSRAECESTMKGESLHTGKLGKTLKDARYAAKV